jgi:AcrR family transcriptional regulator
MNYAPTQTRDRILDAAERLFADDGFEGASIRAIVDAAKVNLAAVHYHFRSKEALLEAVLTRRISVVNESRLQRLHEAEAAAAPQPPSAEAVLRAFIVPTVELAQRTESGATFVQLMSRMFTEPRFSIQEYLGKNFGDTMARFSQALVRSLPHLPRGVVLWRAFFTIGAMHHMLCSRKKVELLGRELRDNTSDSELLEYLLEFSVAGMSTDCRATSVKAFKTPKLETSRSSRKRK